MFANIKAKATGGAAAGAPKEESAPTEAPAAEGEEVPKI